MVLLKLDELGKKNKGLKVDRVARFYEKKALIEYVINDCSAKVNTLVAATIAWFGLFLTEALKQDDIIYPILAFIGLFILIVSAALYYRKGRVWTVQLSRMQATLHITKGGGV